MHIIKVYRVSQSTHGFMASGKAKKSTHLGKQGNKIDSTCGSRKQSSYTYL